MVDKRQDQNIADYKFDSFDDLDAEVTRVAEFDFQPIDQSVMLHKDHDRIIRAEREEAHDANFKINPVVLKYRGLQNQEDEEREQRIASEVESRVHDAYEQAIVKGREEGIALGREEVFQEMRAQTEEQISKLSEMISNVVSTEADILEVQKKDVYHMIKNIAKWVILRELKDDGEYLTRLLERLINELQVRENLLIRVNKAHFDEMPDVLKVVEEHLGELKNVRVEVDYDIAPNGLCVESDNGIVDGSLDTQFKSIDKLFESVIPDEQDN